MVMVKAPHGTEMSCKGWLQEAALRMLMNNLDPEVAERPEDLIVYGGRGKAARNIDCYNAIVKSLQDLENDETLLVQSGKPVGIFKTHSDAPRVLIANSNLVGNWANWEHFDKLEKEGLMMYGQMTAGSWIYIGSQGILQGTFETFAEAARQHFSGSLEGKLVVTGGLGGMGGAQPLAATMNGGTFLAAEMDEERIQKRLDTKYCDEMTDNIDYAIDTALKWKENNIAKSIAVKANIIDLLAKLIERNVTPDLLTDQTSAHDPLIGYIPQLQRPIDASNLVIINPDWSDIRRRKVLNRINESVDWTDDVISDLEAAEDEYEAENVEPSEEKGEGKEEVTEEETNDIKKEEVSEETDYSKMSVAELKDVLKEKGLPVSGKKADLIERLQGDSK